MPTVIPESVNTNVFCFHFLRETRDIDLSQLPPSVTYTHQLSDLVPELNRSDLVAEGVLPSVNDHLDDATIRHYLAHVRMIKKIRQDIDPTGVRHHVILEDQINILPDFFVKHLAIVNNVPRSYDIGHFYVFPQQMWVFNSHKVYETLPGLRGSCAYTLSPSGCTNILARAYPLTKPYDVWLHKDAKLKSYTIVTDMVEHIDPYSIIKEDVDLTIERA